MTASTAALGRVSTGSNSNLASNLVDERAQQPVEWQSGKVAGGKWKQSSENLGHLSGALHDGGAMLQLNTGEILVALNNSYGVAPFGSRIA